MTRYKRVLVVASGETEREALPVLLRELQSDGIAPIEVAVPPSHRALTPELGASVITAMWFQRLGTERQPDKIVVLLDADTSDPREVCQPWSALASRLPRVTAPMRVVAANPHLEAWFFADPRGLREFLSRDLGSVDASAPDGIRNPKLHLRNLLAPRVYTSRVAGRIASALKLAELRRSPSFCEFETAVRNGVRPQRVD